MNKTLSSWFQYGEHPEERAAKNIEVTEKLGDVQTLTHIFTNLKEKVRDILKHLNSNEQFQPWIVFKV